MKKSDWVVGARQKFMDGKVELTAEARYVRGSIPSFDDIKEINTRVKAKFPTAEFVGMERTFVPVGAGVKPTEVWWCLMWYTF